jgi:methionyl aminopeptidase
VPINKIGEVCAQVAQKHKLTVVKDFIGHGVGTVFHADPQVFHHKTMQSLGTMQVGQQQEISLNHPGQPSG